MIQVTRQWDNPVPCDVQAILTRAGGTNLYGKPNLRVVWGPSRLCFIGGTKESPWEDRDDSGSLIRETLGLRRVPKYDRERWVFERWLPPNIYARRQWDENELGPFPHLGDYEHIKTLDLNGEFVQLTPTIAREVADRLRRTVVRSRSEVRRAVFAQHERKESEYDSFADAVLTDAMPAFHGQPSVQVA